MRLLYVLTLIAVCSICSTGSVGSKSASEQPDIGESGRDFLELCAGIDSESNGSSARIRKNKAS